MYPSCTQRSGMKQYRPASTSRKQCPINAPYVCGYLGLKDLQKIPPPRF